MLIQGYENPLKVVFFGTPDFAMPVLQALIENGYNVSHFKSKTLKDDETFETFKLLNPDLCIVAAYGKIIPKKFLEIPKYGFLNVHPSILPKYRGPSPIQTAILNGDAETGASVMVVDKEIDHGPTLASAKYTIPNTKHHTEIATEATDIFKLGAKLLIEILPKYISGEIEAEPQDHSQATFTKMFTRADGRINWDSPTQEIYNQIRALNPEPGTWTTWKNKVFNIPNIEAILENARVPLVIQGAPLQPGTIFKVGDNIAVSTKKCYLILKSIQLEGGKVMDAKSFVNGHPDFLNSKLE